MTGRWFQSPIHKFKDISNIFKWSRLGYVTMTEQGWNSINLHFPLYSLRIQWIILCNLPTFNEILWPDISSLPFQNSNGTSPFPIPGLIFHCNQPLPFQWHLVDCNYIIFPCADQYSWLFCLTNHGPCIDAF